MVQKEPLTLYGFTLEHFEKYLYLDQTSPSGLRWKVTVCSTATKDSVAGCYSETVKFPCWRLKLDKVAMILARVLWFMHYKEPPRGVIDHRNGNTKDHSINNLREVTLKVNNENRKVGNETGLPGVYLREDKYGNLIFRCQGTDSAGKRWSRVFSTVKYGYEAALRMAKECRLAMEDSNNTQTRRKTLNVDAGADEGLA